VRTLPRIVLHFGLAAVASAPALVAQGRDVPPPRTHRGIEISVVGVERASSAALGDCPPGANTQRAMARAGEEFAIVTVALAVKDPAAAGPAKRPVLVDAAGKTYNTAASFVDPGKTPASSCQFPFRIPTATKLKTLQIDSLRFDLTGLAPP
jgi:hypothetical protein